MKRVMLILILVISISGAARADLFTANNPVVTDKTDVGSLDTLLAHASLQDSGDGTELDWVKKTLGRTDISLDAKYSTNESKWIWEETKEKGVFALRFLTDAPDYFLIKTGNINVKDTDHNTFNVKDTDPNTFLFQNNANLNWGVITLSFGPNITLKDLGKISHIDEFKVTSAAVPEPATMLLLGFGLIGMAAFVWKVKSR